MVAALRNWLPAYCRTLPGISRGVAVVREHGERRARPVAIWPDDADCSDAMLELAHAALCGKTSMTRMQTAAGPVDRIAMPITHQGQQLGALVCEADDLTPEGREMLLAQLQRSSPGDHATSGQDDSEAAGYRLAIVLELLATSLTARTAQGAAMALVTEMATRLGCNRVSYGRRVRGRLRVLAVSHNALLDRRTNLARAIEAAMEEACEQAATIAYPDRGEHEVADREHRALARLQGNSNIVTVLLAHEQQIVGALTLERQGQTPFDESVLELCESLGLVIGPLLELRYRDDQPLFRKAGAAARHTLTTICGPRYPGRKLLGAVTIAFLTWLSVASGTYRITAAAVIEGSITRAIVAPMDGFVGGAFARPGDRLEEGTLMARIDDREIKLELTKWESELAQLRKQHRGARAARDRARTAIANAEIARAEAQVELLESQLARTELRAPFSGIVVAGDLSQLLGSPVERGAVLFEIAPLDDYRVVLEIDERDVAALAVGQRGRLALAGLPGRRLDLTIEQITPVARAEDERNFFRVDARLKQSNETLRPGMAGFAKIDAGERRLVWIWTHRVVDWLRLALWRWQP